MNNKIDRITYRKALQEFSIGKMKILERYGVKVKGIKFMTSKDIEAIEKWSEKECKKIFEKLNEFHRLEDESCVFCHKYVLSKLESCNTCSYGKNHGICGKDIDNHYDEFRELFDDKIFDNDKIHPEYQSDLTQLYVELSIKLNRPDLLTKKD